MSVAYIAHNIKISNNSEKAPKISKRGINKIDVQYYNTFSKLIIIGT